MPNEPDILNVLSEYIPLKKTGKRYKTCCPFHEEQTASLFVDTDTNLWHCFGCGAGGDAFSFIQQIEGVDLEAAAVRIEEITGEAVEAPSPSHAYYVEVKQTGERIAWAKTAGIAFVLIEALAESRKYAWSTEDLYAAPDTSEDAP